MHFHGAFGGGRRGGLGCLPRVFWETGQGCLVPGVKCCVGAFVLFILLPRGLSRIMNGVLDHGRLEDGFIRDFGSCPFLRRSPFSLLASPYCSLICAPLPLSGSWLLPVLRLRDGRSEVMTYFPVLRSRTGEEWRSLAKGVLDEWRSGQPPPKQS
ncbi:hypothetical protein B0T24DRAFT_74117 [Lasiosphaeria ovina]|uniref:Uncharacterized protein n=1 Tax=Lasiosphaeria ovina TaxID=92902 RepID=A0AAE0NML8_9PEZI|nr:hypothetical protein B0T24DRAFT_74117 [Lasiosphaeria ovina]